MIQRYDANGFPLPDVPGYDALNQDFGREVNYAKRGPVSAVSDLEAMAAANNASAASLSADRTPASGRYVYNSATGEYIWVPAGTTAPATAGLSALQNQDQRGGGGRDAFISTGSSGTGADAQGNVSTGIGGFTLGPDGKVTPNTTPAIFGAIPGLGTILNMVNDRANKNAGAFKGAIQDTDPNFNGTNSNNTNPTATAGPTGTGGQAAAAAAAAAQAATANGASPAAAAAAGQAAANATLGGASPAAAAAAGAAAASTASASTNANDAGVNSGPAAAAAAGVTGGMSGFGGSAVAPGSSISGGLSQGPGYGGGPAGGGAPAGGGFTDVGGLGAAAAADGAEGGYMANGGLAAFAKGGLGDLGGYSDGGRLLRGPGDGVSDSIPASIGGKRPARLADGEFVVPARIVSELGNGSTEAGARKLYAMLDRIQAGRKKSIGKGKVAANSRASKHLPA